MAADRWVGQVLGGRYKIEELLGQGGMSSVYKARDPNLQRTVAIKLIHPHLSNDEEFVRRFEIEATSIARLRHPNIVQVFDFNHENDLYYMVLEFVAGETLQNRIKRLNAAGRSLPVRDIVNYTIDICKAADYAHQRGLIHRDIKPANVMLDVHGSAILMDFGIARMLGGQGHTATGAVLGTALYMSPEQIQGLHPDARSDIYSIGVMLFEALGGHPPFEADSAMTLMMMHMNDPVPDLSKLHPGLPDPLKAIVYCALEKDRANRFQTCAEMADALVKVRDLLGKEVDIPASVPVSEKPAPPQPAEVTMIEPPAPVPLQATIIEGPVPVAVAAQAAAIASSSSTIVETAAPPLVSAVSQVAAAPRRGSASKKMLLWIGLAVLVVGLIGGGYFVLQSLKEKEPAAAVVSVTGTFTPTSPPATQTQAPFTQTPLPTRTPLPVATNTPVIVATATLPAPVAPVIGGADKLAYLLSSDVWLANIDGSDSLQLTHDGTTKKYLRWLPDGSGLSYISGKCLQTIALDGLVATITCFNNSEYFDSFEVSPDGKQAAISVDRLLYLVPFDLQQLAQVDSHPDLVGMAVCKELAPYQRNAAVSARWSADSKTLAIIILGVLDSGKRGDLVQIVAVDRCISNPAVQIQFPQPHFTFGEYDRTPKLTSFAWDGVSLFAMTGLTRNEYFGELHLFNGETYKADLSVNPINGSCCYSDIQFSPDGKYLLFSFQDITLGANSFTQIYYIPYGTIGSGAKYEPLPLPANSNPKELPMLILRRAVNP